MVNEDWTVKSSHFLTSSTPYYSYSVYSYNEVLSTDLGKTKILEMFGNFMFHIYISHKEVSKIVLVFYRLEALFEMYLSISLEAKITKPTQQYQMFGTVKNYDFMIFGILS